MTTENCLIFDLKDITNIQFECGKCRSRYVAPVLEWKKLPRICGNCGEQFFEDRGMEHDAFRQFQEGIMKLAESKTDKYKIRFEVGLPSSFSS